MTTNPKHPHGALHLTLDHATAKPATTNPTNETDRLLAVAKAGTPNAMDRAKMTVEIFRVDGVNVEKESTAFVCRAFQGSHERDRKRRGRTARPMNRDAAAIDPERRARLAYDAKLANAWRGPTETPGVPTTPTMNRDGNPMNAEERATAAHKFELANAWRTPSEESK